MPLASVRGYFKSVCDYVHLNSWRAGLISPKDLILVYGWSSCPLYLRPAGRPPWLRVDRLLGEQGIQADRVEDRMELPRLMEDRRREGEPPDR